MPIRVNLLAEAQILEEIRRKDPVKRAIYMGILLAVAMLVWSISLQLAIFISKSNLVQVQGEIASRTNQWQKVLFSQKRYADAKTKLDSLARLSEARFLQGNFMNALQQLDLDSVQLTHARVAQTYSQMDAVPNQTNNNHVVTGHPAMKTEKIVISLDCKDTSPVPGDHVNKFKDAVASAPYFKNILSKTNGVQLTSLSPPQPSNDGRSYVLFTLECNLPLQSR